MLHGPCRHCGGLFQSRDVKLFCSLPCYLASDLRKEHVARLVENAKKQRQERVPILCLNCGKEKLVIPSVARDAKTGNQSRSGRRRKASRFCSRSCWRAWLARGYDRWVANPQTIALPQCFDEFLNKEHLPCLVDGCDWEGVHLAQHAQMAHGIPAEEFKKLVGFNKTTGLVGIGLREELAERAPVAFGEAGGFACLTEEQIVDLREAGRKPRGPKRLEAREHYVKAAAERDWAGARANIARRQGILVRRVCDICAREFESTDAKWNQKYCSAECRAEGAKRRNAESARRRAARKVRAKAGPAPPEVGY